MLKSKLSWLFVVMVALTLAACSGGGGGNPAATTTPTTITTPTDTTTPIPPTPPTISTNPAVAVLTGIFVDAPVEGLTYVSGTQTGTTDASGTFRYEDGKTVQFRVGNVVLGQALGKTLITPTDLVKFVDVIATAADLRAIQITQFLMTVDASTTTAKMTIPAFVAIAALNETAVNLSQTPVDVAAILGRLTTHPVVTPAAAAAHIQGSLTTFTAAQITGVFAAVDSATTPKLGLQLNAKANLAGDAFDVTGVAANIQGATWTITGTMTTGGSLQATGTGTGAAPPTNMTITGAMTSATQINAAASFSLNNTLQQVPVVFEKAVAPLVTGKFSLAADPGVSNATQTQHIAASLTILPDGQVRTQLVEGEITGPALALVLGGRFVGLSGVVTSAGNLIAVGGFVGTSETAVSRSSTPPSSVVLLTGSFDTVASSAAVKVTSLDITGGGLTIPLLNFVKATNTMVGVFTGTHSDKAPNPPGTVAFGVNNDGSVHGYTRFVSPGARFPEKDNLLDGVVDAVGVLGLSPGFAVGNLGAIGIPPGAPGLVMTDDGGASFGVFVGVFAGTINPAAGTAAGNWVTGPGVPATGTFSTILLP
jgi:hypothetical protein